MDQMAFSFMTDSPYPKQHCSEDQHDGQGAHRRCREWLGKNLRHALADGEKRSGGDEQREAHAPEMARQARGAARLARHLWRMCFALFIAAGSFFSIRERVAKILPQPFTTAPMRALPIVLIFGAMLFWIWRVRHERKRHLVHHLAADDALAHVSSGDVN